MYAQAGVVDDRGSWPLSAGAGSCENEGRGDEERCRKAREKQRYYRHRYLIG